MNTVIKDESGNDENGNVAIGGDRRISDSNDSDGRPFDFSSSDLDDESGQDDDEASRIVVIADATIDETDDAPEHWLKSSTPNDSVVGVETVLAEQLNTVCLLADGVESVRMCTTNSTTGATNGSSSQTDLIDGGHSEEDDGDSEDDVMKPPTSEVEFYSDEDEAIVNFLGKANDIVGALFLEGYNTKWLWLRFKCWSMEICYRVSCVS